MELYYYSTKNEIIIFWDRDYFGTEKYIYEIYKDGILYEKTEKTHFTLSGLSPDHQYKLEIRALLDGICIRTSEKLIKTAKEKNKINVTDAPYNAVGDGITENTGNLQKAIDVCTEDDCLYIPKGVFLAGALRLHSNMEIYLDEGAVLCGTENWKDYLPLIDSRFEGIEQQCYSSLINIGTLDKNSGINCENVLIHGKGSILGGGKALAQNIIEYEKSKPGYSEACMREHYDDMDVLAGRKRPRLINISNSKNVIIKGLTIGNGPSWNVHSVYSENIITNGCKFVSKGIWNGDGWDPDSSKNCTIFDCVFETSDDCIAIKSGKNPEGNVINRPCENIRIFDCRAVQGHAGIAIGSEMSGGINNVRVWNCDFANVRTGIEIKATKKRGGYVKNVVVKECIVPSIQLHSVWYNDDGEGATETPTFENFSFEGMEITGQPYVKPAAKTFDGIPDTVDYCCIDIAGFDSNKHAAKNIRFKDINIRQTDNKNQEIRLKFCEAVSFENISCKGS